MTPPLAKPARRELALILLAAFVLRAVLLAVPRTFHPDEIYQYLEPAHRLVFGTGVLPWEWHRGIRSWLLPVLLAGPMRLGDWLAPGTALYLLAPRLALCLWSLGAVVAAWGLGRRISPRHARWAAIVAAASPELAFFAGQALTDSIALPPALLGALLLTGERRPARMAGAGALLALAAVVRFPYAPPLLVLAAWSLRGDWRAWGALAAGALAMLALAAVPDMAVGRAPYGWVVANFTANIGEGVARAYGVSDPLFLVGLLFMVWAVWILPGLWLASIGARRLPALGAMALANLVVHAAISHKEYRFVLLGTTALTILATIGAIDWLEARETALKRFGLVTGALAAGVTWCLMPGFLAWDLRVSANEAFAAAGRDPATCGLAVDGTWWAMTGGQTYLHRDVPIAYPERLGPGQLAAHGAAYNTIVAPPKDHLPAGYRQLACFGPQGRFEVRALCVWRRPGPCDPAALGPVALDKLIDQPDRENDPFRKTLSDR